MASMSGLGNAGAAYNAPVGQHQQPYAYLTFLIFDENVAVLIIQLITLPLDINLLITSAFYPKKLTVSSHASGTEHGALSKSMAALISTHAISMALMLPYLGYVVTAWRVPEVQPRNAAVFNPSLLFWLGVSCNLTLVIPSAAVFFLTLDRLLTLTWGHAYGRREKTLFLHVEIVVLTAVALALIGSTIIYEWPLQWDEGKCGGLHSLLRETLTNISGPLRIISLHPDPTAEYGRLLHENCLRYTESNMHMRIPLPAAAAFWRQEQCGEYFWVLTLTSLSPM